MKLVLAGSVCLALSLSLGCSDPPAAPAQGAASIWFQPRSGVGGSCLPSAAIVTVPASADQYISCNPESGSCTPTKKVAVDGDGAEVTCTVRKSGDSYILGGSLVDDDVGFNFSFQTAAAVPETGGTITVSGSKKFGETTLTDSGCTLTIHALGKGSIWGSYTCPNMGEEQAPQPICLASGSFAFENCDT